MTTNYFICTLGQASELCQNLDFNNISQFLDIQAKKVPELPAVGFIQPSDDDLKPWTHSILDFRDIKTGSHAVAKLLLKLIPTTVPRGRTIALLCASTADFLFTWLALIRLGHPALLIAPQCAPQAIAHLCKTCEVSLLFYDEIYKDLAQSSAKSSRDDRDFEMVVKVIPFLRELIASTISQNTNQTISSRYHANGSRPSVAWLADATAESLETDPASVAYLHHTSGTSSGIPKPIPQSHRAAVGVLPRLDGSRNATFTTTPLYHGGIADLFRAWTSNALIWLFPGKGIPITARNVVCCLGVVEECAKKGETPPVKYFSSVPYVLQMLASDRQGLEKLHSMDIVGVGGAALPAEIGDELVRSGVNLVSRYGSAECGFIMSSHRDYEEDQDWQYLRSERGSAYLRFDSREDGLSELVILPGWPHMAKKNREDGSYATADLFAPHPRIPNAWKYHSRADSQLTLITGKKFDPAPVESAIAISALLDDVLIFGNGRPYPGALLFRSPQAREMTDEELIAATAPMVEKLNADTQSHARIPRNMLIPMAFGEGSLEKSSKGTVIRGKAEERCSEAIERAYASSIITDGVEVPDSEVSKAILQIIESVIGKSGDLTELTDLFSYGVDSVACVQIRFSVMQLLPHHLQEVPLTVVEDCGTVERLSDFVIARRNGQKQDSDDAESEHQLMLDLVEEYSKFDGGLTSYDGTHKDTMNCVNGAVAHPSTDIALKDEEKKEIVVLTGATGALGAHILDLYRRSNKVLKIYCLVRGTHDHAAYKRVSKALEQRNLGPLDINPTMEISSGKVTIVRAKLSEPDLGLSPELYSQIIREATIIMHIAWAVNFRVSLHSFVRDHVSGVRNLINLALHSPHATPPRFAFCSSVASVSEFALRATIPERAVDDPSTASSLGYSQSKWVAEQICQRAHKRTRLNGRIAVFRAGQLSGDSQTGIWNEKEAWPMMLSSVKVTGCLPDLRDEALTWLPVDIAARAFVEVTESVELDKSQNQEMEVYHIVNDNRSVTWTDLLGWLRKLEKFEVVEPRVWVGRLEKLNGDSKQHPALKLLAHWKNVYGRENIGKREFGDFSLSSANGGGIEKQQNEQIIASTSTKEEFLDEHIQGQYMSRSLLQEDPQHEQPEWQDTRLTPNRYALEKTKQVASVMRSVMPADEVYFQKIWRWIMENS